MLIKRTLFVRIGAYNEEVHFMRDVIQQEKWYIYLLAAAVKTIFTCLLDYAQKHV